MLSIWYSLNSSRSDLILRSGELCKFWLPEPISLWLGSIDFISPKSSKCLCGFSTFVDFVCKNCWNCLLSTLFRPLYWITGECSLVWLAYLLSYLLSKAVVFFIILKVFMVFCSYNNLWFFSSSSASSISLFFISSSSLYFSSSFSLILSFFNFFFYLI